MSTRAGLSAASAAPADSRAGARSPFATHFHALRAGRMHYVDEGPRDAPVVLCLHGNPTWSFYWRALVRGLSDRWRVIAPDHIGCGLSDKPQDWEYTLAAHVENLESLVESLGLARVTLALHDWGGAIGMGLARRKPERIERLIVTNTAAFTSTRLPWRLRACRVPVLGEFLVRRMNAFAGLAPRLASARRGGLSAEARLGLGAPYRTSAERVAIARFVQDIPMSPRDRSWSELAAIESALSGFTDRPTCLIWGLRDWCFSPAFLAEWQRRFPNARTHALPDAGHLVLEDATERVVAHAREFLTGTESAR